MPVNSWYESWIAPIQSDIGPALQACATPGLFYDAAIGADLGQALAALFPLSPKPVISPTEAVLFPVSVAATAVSSMGGGGCA